MGLFSNDPFPSIVIGCLLNAAIDVNILKDKPLSPQLIMVSIGLTPLLLIEMVPSVL